MMVNFGKGMQRIVIMLLLLLNGVAHAEVKTPEELCIARNAASCEINGLQFFITDEECPRGAKVLRPQGHERCKQLAEDKKVVEKKQDTVAKSNMGELVAASSPVAKKQDTTAAIWGNPYFIVALIGLLQGLISRASIGTFIIVAIAMPVLATWSMLSGAQFPSGWSAALVYMGVEFAGIFLFSMAGWIVGLGLHRGILKLLYK
jgi:hypothetical protein